MGRKIVLPFGRAIVASGALIVDPDAAATVAEVPCETRPAANQWYADDAPEEAPTGLRTPAQAAWEQRDRILSLEARAGRAHDFLVLAFEHDHEDYGVSEAAYALGFTRQRLHREALSWFGLPPGVVLDLPRMCSVYRDILASQGSLSSIAAEHRFPDLSKMGRFTLRFTGLRPRALRETRGRRGSPG